MWRLFPTLILLLCASKSFAKDSHLQIGVGMNSFTSGRQLPALYAGYSGSSWAASATSTGYQTRYDYLAGYTAAGFRSWEFGELWGSAVSGGLGVGMYYGKRGYRERPGDESLREWDDFGMGPAFRVHWYPWDVLFLGVETILGVGHPNNILLVFQDVSQLSMGVSF